MSADYPLTITAAETERPALMSAKSADKALRAATKFWFIVTIAGQLFFAFTVASFYGLTAMRGDVQAWNRFMLRGHVSGDGAGNAVVAAHLVAAVIIILAGAIQFIPRIRDRYPRFHRWVGRTYVLTALVLTTAGLYMLYVRGAIGDASQRAGSTVNAVLIWVCAAMTMKYAIAGDMRTHRRWATRLFLVVSAAWFFRAAFFLSLVIFNGPFGFDPLTFSGPFLTFMAFAQYLLPLAILELYFLAQARPGVMRRVAMAATLFALTLGTAVGVLAITTILWIPALKTAYDSRISIVRKLSATIESEGINAALRQYRTLESAGATTYNLDENQLNLLGYELLRANKVEEAIAMFRLNAEAYPQSANAYDSLAEAHMRAGHRELAIANYRKSLQLDPDNRNAAVVLRKLAQ